MCSSQEKMFLLCPYEDVLTLQTAHGNFLVLCQMVLHPNINFLIIKQNKTPKIDLKLLKQEAGIAILRHALFFTQINRPLKSNIDKWINKDLYCNELDLFSALFLF